MADYGPYVPGGHVLNPDYVYGVTWSGTYDIAAPNVGLILEGPRAGQYDADVIAYLQRFLDPATGQFTEAGGRYYGPAFSTLPSQAPAAQAGGGGGGEGAAALFRKPLTWVIVGGIAAITVAVASMRGGN